MKAFVVAAVVVNALASLIARRSHNHTIDVAAALDMTVTVTALYYWLVVRRGLRSRGSMVFVASVSLLRVSLAFGNPWLGGIGEAAIIGSVWGGLVSFPFLTWELSVLYYAVAWRARPDIPAGTTAFTLHKRDGFSDLLMMVGFASLFEIIPVHLFAAHWSVRIAWVLTGLSLYGAIWAVSLSRSFALRPTLVGNGEVLIRFGLMFSLRVPLDSIAIRKTEPISGALVVPRNSTPTLYLGFKEPLQAGRMLGLKKQVTAIGISPDDLSAFQAAIG